MTNTINECLDSETEKRPTIEKLINETFFNLIDRFGCDKEDEAAVKFLSEYDTTNLINYKEVEHWRTALFAACQWGMFRTVKVLLDRGADITFYTKSIKTALHAAA
jgi:hypothetical protein